MNDKYRSISRQTLPLAKATVTLLLALALTSCAGAVPPAPTALPSPTSAALQAATLPASPVPATAAVTTTPPAPTALPTPDLSHPAMTVLAENLPGPDDLLLGPDGSIYISDVTDGAIRRLAADGSIQVVVSGLSEPEGMVLLPDGALVIVEQGKNRLVRLDLKTKTLTKFLDLENKTGQAGVDGIALDARPGKPSSLIIPDSPNGRVLRASLDGHNVVEIARGLARPTGAWVEPDGSLLVVDENGNRLVRIRPDGNVQGLANLSIPDDVIEDSLGNIYVATLGDQAVHAIRAGDGQDIVLTGALADPQGIIFDAQGNLVVADAGHHRLVKIAIRP